MAEVRSIPAPQPTTETRTFPAKGREWTFTIYVDGRENGERFYALTSCLVNPLLPSEPLIADLPPEAQDIQALLSGGDTQLAGAIPAKKVERRQIVISNPVHISNLRVLHAVLVEPALSLSELIELDYRLGAAAMEPIYDWAAETNGLGEYLLQKLEEVKNRQGVEKLDLLTPFSMPASNGSTPSPNKPSEARIPKASSGSSASRKRAATPSPR